MAEADPHVIPQIQVGMRPTIQESQKTISLLKLATNWTFDTYGISTVTRSLVNNLRLIDPDTKAIKITCAVLDEEGKIEENQLRDAEKHGVRLRGAKQPRGKKTKPEIKWLNEDMIKYYHHLITDDKYDFIVGHIPNFADGCLNLTDLSKELHKGHSPKVIMVAHTLPLTEEGDIDEEGLVGWLDEADLVLSVGDNMRMKIETYKRAHDIPIENKLYLPGFPLDFFRIRQTEKGGPLFGEQNILLMAAHNETSSAKGLDFELAMLSSAMASAQILSHEGANLSKQLGFNLSLIAARDEEKAAWEKIFEQMKVKHKIVESSLTLRFHANQGLEKLMSHMRTASVLPFTLKSHSPRFGVEALVAMAAGVPVLVSRNSGIASFLQSIGETEPIVWDSKGILKDREVWKQRLMKLFTNTEKAQSAAAELRKVLLLGARIPSTHLNFMKYVTDSMRTQLVIDLGCGPISTETVQAAIRFGVEIENPNDPVSTQTYVVAYFRHLVCQREKLGQGLLADHIRPAVAEMWQEVLSYLEERERRVLDVGAGSLLFTLFCPTVEATLQLQDEIWRDKLKKSQQKLLKTLGVEENITVRPSEVSQAITDHDMLLTLPELKLSRSIESGGKSIGYETMTSGSEFLSGMERKVEDWLFLGHEEEDHALTLVKHWHLGHIQTTSRVYLGYRFAVSESEVLGISCIEKPSLSTILPDVDEGPLVLSGDYSYRSTEFVKIDGVEYLVATCNNDSSIHLWNVENCSSRVVYQLNSPPPTAMNLCSIDNRTIACSTLDRSIDGCYNCYILKVGPDQFTLSSTLRLSTDVEDIYDIAYMKTPDCCVVAVQS